MITRLFSSAAFWFLLFLVIAEIFARSFLPYRTIISENQGQLRNPLVNRAWPEYVAMAQGDRPIILLGNSQSVGLELPNVNETYPAIVERRLRQSNPELSLWNWSVTGLRQHQLELLTRKAIAKKPQLVVFILSLNNFSGISRFSVNKDPSDIPLMLGDSNLYPQVLNSELVKDIELDDYLYRVILSNSGIARLKIYIDDIIAGIASRRHHNFLFGHLRSPAAMKLIEDRKKVSIAAQVRSTQIKMSKQQWIAALRKKQYANAMSFYQSVVPEFREANINFVWAWMPFAKRPDTEHILLALNHVQAEFCQALARDKVDCFDWSDEIEPQHFLSHDLSSHMSEHGHLEMSSLVYSAVLDVIHKR